MAAFEQVGRIISAAGGSSLRISLNNADTVNFIKLYQQEELLWNVNLHDHTNKTKRSECLRRISQLMGNNWSEQQVKDKIISLRSRYCKEIVKVRVSIASGAAEAYKPVWRYFPLLDDFLRPFSVTRKTDSPVVRAFHKRLMEGMGQTRPQVSAHTGALSEFQHDHYMQQAPLTSDASRQPHPIPHFVEDDDDVEIVEEGDTEYCQNGAMSVEEDDNGENAYDVGSLEPSLDGGGFFLNSVTDVADGNNDCEENRSAEGASLISRGLEESCDAETQELGSGDGDELAEHDQGHIQSNTGRTPHSAHVSKDPATQIWQGHDEEGCQQSNSSRKMNEWCEPSVRDNSLSSVRRHRMSAHVKNHPAAAGKYMKQEKHLSPPSPPVPPLPARQSFPDMYIPSKQARGVGNSAFCTRNRPSHRMGPEPVQKRIKTENFAAWSETPVDDQMDMPSVSFEDPRSCYGVNHNNESRHANRNNNYANNRNNIQSTLSQDSDGPSSAMNSASSRTTNPSTSHSTDDTDLASRVTSQVTSAVTSQMTAILQSLVSGLADRCSGKTSDGEAAFVNHLACELRQLDEDLQADVKFSIQQALYDAKKVMNQRRTLRVQTTSDSNTHSPLPGSEGTEVDQDSQASTLLS